MPNQRDKTKKLIAFWISTEQVKKLRRVAKQMGIRSLNIAARTIVFDK